MNRRIVVSGKRISFIFLKLCINWIKKSTFLYRLILISICYLICNISTFVFLCHALIIVFLVLWGMELSHLVNLKFYEVLRLGGM